VTPQQQTETLYRWMLRSVADAAWILERRFGDGPEDGVSETSGSLE